MFSIVFSTPGLRRPARVRSDIEFLVEFDPGTRPFELLALGADLEELLGVRRCRHRRFPVDGDPRRGARGSAGALNSTVQGE